MLHHKETIWIYSIAIISLALSGFVCCHSGNKKILNELNVQVEEIKEGQDTIRLMIETLHESLLEKAEESATKEEPQGEDDVQVSVEEEAMLNTKVKKFMERLDKLEHNIDAIENYVHDERETDSFLRGLRGDIGRSFDENMQEVKTLAAGMKDELRGSFVDVDHELSKVETFANSRNVIIGGVLYYDGIGSACDSEYNVCRVEDSECRDGKCQCLPGLSHDSLQQTCVDSCEGGYGNTYQTVHKYIIRGYNRATMNETSLEECQERCQTEHSFECRSFDYFPRWNACYLSEKVKSDTEDGWEYNSAGIHFQRDCAIDKL